MLRNVLFGIGVFGLALGAGGAVLGFFSMVWGCFIWGGILVAAIVYERFRYKPLATLIPGSGWQRTNERFVDDETGKTVTVYIQPETGERQYVKE